jgi:hypothetical protein
MKVEITENIEREGVEIRFAGPISPAISHVLRENGFHFHPDRKNHGADKRWWTKRTPQRLTFAQNLVIALADQPQQVAA